MKESLNKLRGEGKLRKLCLAGVDKILKKREVILFKQQKATYE